MIKKSIKNLKPYSKYFIYQSKLQRFSQDNKQNNTLETDVLIVGGGITGTSLACSLAESDFF